MSINNSYMTYQYIKKNKYRQKKMHPYPLRLEKEVHHKQTNGISLLRLKLNRIMI